MVAFLTRMPAGIPGEINSVHQATVEPQVITPSGTTGAPTAYGVPLVIDATTHNMRTMTASDTHCYGVLARPFPTGGSQDPLGTSTLPAQGVCDVLRVGYMSVLLSGSTAAAKGGQVYIWTAAASGTHIVGGWEAADPTSNGIAVPGATFQGPADADGNVQISIDCRIPA